MSMRTDDDAPTVPGPATEIGDALERWGKHIDNLVTAGEVIAFLGRDS